MGKHGRRQGWNEGNPHHAAEMRMSSEVSHSPSPSQARATSDNATMMGRSAALAAPYPRRSDHGLEGTFERMRQREDQRLLAEGQPPHRSERGVSHFPLPSASRPRDRRSGSGSRGGSGRSPGLAASFPMRSDHAMDGTLDLVRQREDQRLLAAFLQRRQQEDALIAAAVARASGNISLATNNHHHRPLDASAMLGGGSFLGQHARLQSLLRQQQQQHPGLRRDTDHFVSDAALHEQRPQQLEDIRSLTSVSDGQDKESNQLSDDLGSDRSQSRVKQSEDEDQKIPHAADEKSMGSDQDESSTLENRNEETKDDKDPQDEDCSSDEDDKKRPSGGVVEHFPKKLYRILEEAESNGNSDTLSFLPHGRAFAIHKPRKFVSDIMPKYFTTTRLASFQRQLNLYGFRRISDGTDKGAYSHRYFVKGRKDLIKKIRRRKANSHRFSFINQLAAAQEAATRERVLLQAGFLLPPPVGGSTMPPPSLLPQRDGASSWPGITSSLSLGAHQPAASFPGLGGGMPAAATIMALGGGSTQGVAASLLENRRRDELMNHPMLGRGAHAPSLSTASASSAAETVLREQALSEQQLLLARLRQQRASQASHSQRSFERGGTPPPF